MYLDAVQILTGPPHTRPYHRADCIRNVPRPRTKTHEAKDMGTTRWSAHDGRDASHCVHVVVRNRIVASHTHAHTCFTQITSVEHQRSTSEPDHMGKNKKRAQPLSKWSDDRTQSVGCFRTGCRGWQLYGNDTNVCSTTGAACAPGVADIDMAVQASLTWHAVCLQTTANSNAAVVTLFFCKRTCCR